MDAARLEGIGQTGTDLGDDIEQADVFEGDRHFAGIDLGHVEHVVDRARQFLGSRLDRFKIGPLFGVAAGVLGVQQVGITDDGGQGCAQFIGDIGDEIALESDGFAQRLVSRLDGLFQLARGGDVGKGDQGGAVRQGLGAPLRPGGRRKS